MAARVPTVDDLAVIDEVAATAARRGSDYLSIRRLAELIGTTTLDTYAALIALVEHHRPRHYTPSLYRCGPA